MLQMGAMQQRAGMQMERVHQQQRSQLLAGRRPKRLGMWHARSQTSSASNILDSFYWETCRSFRSALSFLWWDQLAFCASILSLTLLDWH